MSNTLVSMISMGVLGIGLSIALVIASKKFAVESDPRVDDLEGVLPGANCGACGYAGCRSFAEALATGEAPTNGCPVVELALRSWLLRFWVSRIVALVEM